MTGAPASGADPGPDLFDRVPDARPRAWIARVWEQLYSFGYWCLRGVVLLFFRSAFLVRAVGGTLRLPPGAAILAANHASYLDPAFVQLVVSRRVTFMMTNQFYRSPWGRWFFWMTRAIPVGTGRLAHDGLRRAISLLRAGRVIGIFPEGRLTADGRLNAPQRGLAILARKSGAPVYPVSIIGSRRAWPRGSRRPRRADVRILFGRPLRWTGPTREMERDLEQAFAERVHRDVADGLARLGASPSSLTWDREHGR